MKQTAIIKLTSAIGIKGQLVRAGEVIEVPEDAAKDLLRRGKAVLATEADEPTTQLDEGDQDDEESEAAAAAEAAAKAEAEAVAKAAAEAAAKEAAAAAEAAAKAKSGKKK